MLWRHSFGQRITRDYGVWVRDSNRCVATPVTPMSIVINDYDIGGRITASVEILLQCHPQKCGTTIQQHPVDVLTVVVRQFCDTISQIVWLTTCRRRLAWILPHSPIDGYRTRRGVVVCTLNRQDRRKDLPHLVVALNSIPKRLGDRDARLVSVPGLVVYEFPDASIKPTADDVVLVLVLGRDLHHSAVWVDAFRF